VVVAPDDVSLLGAREAGLPPIVLEVLRAGRDRVVGVVQADAAVAVAVDAVPEVAPRQELRDTERARPGTAEIGEPPVSKSDRRSTFRSRLPGSAAIESRASAGRMRLRPVFAPQPDSTWMMDATRLAGTPYVFWAASNASRWASRQRWALYAVRLVRSGR
jgi:hypothetical protein